jgi:hypothetical protein
MEASSLGQISNDLHFLSKTESPVSLDSFFFGGYLVGQNFHLK